MLSSFSSLTVVGEARLGAEVGPMVGGAPVVDEPEAGCERHEPRIASHGLHPPKEKIHRIRRGIGEVPVRLGKRTVEVA